MDKQLAKQFIERVGIENAYQVYADGEIVEVYFDNKQHGVAFKVTDSTHAAAREGEWLQVHQWEGDNWGAAMHSLRSLSDVAAFAQTLVTFAKIKAKRRNKE